MVRVAKSLAGFCVVRNCSDLIGLVCGHYLRIGLGHIRFIDDGSSDGTYEWLSKLARKEARISVVRVDNPQFYQAELMNETANELICEGFSLFLPFDADEFWNVDGPELENRYRDNPEITFSGRWVNFVQSKKVTKAGPLHLLRINHSAPILNDAGQETITAFKRPFVCMTTRKIGFKTKRPVKLGLGQHDLNAGPTECDKNPYEIFHLPFRSKGAIISRALDYEPRRSALRSHHTVSWQSLFHRQAYLSGRIDDVWHANSVDYDGFLNCVNERFALNRDRRLQKIFLKSFAHIALRYRMLLP
jgi:hypothetical protein